MSFGGGGKEDAMVVEPQRQDDSLYIYDHDNRVSWYLKFQYSLPSLGLAAVQVMMSTFVPRFYSDTLQMSLAVLGWLNFASLAFTAFMDPLNGFASDFTRTRFGRRRPYIFFGGIYLGVSIFFLLVPLRSLESNQHLGVSRHNERCSCLDSRESSIVQS